MMCELYMRFINVIVTAALLTFQIDASAQKISSIIKCYGLYDLTIDQDQPLNSFVKYNSKDGPVIKSVNSLIKYNSNLNALFFSMPETFSLSRKWLDGVKMSIIFPLQIDSKSKAPLGYYTKYDIQILEGTADLFKVMTAANKPIGEAGDQFSFGQYYTTDLNILPIQSGRYFQYLFFHCQIKYFVKY